MKLLKPNWTNYYPIITLVNDNIDIYVSMAIIFKDPGNILVSLAMATLVVLFEATIATKMVLDACIRENGTHFFDESLYHIYA